MNDPDSPVFKLSRATVTQALANIRAKGSLATTQTYYPLC